MIRPRRQVERAPRPVHGGPPGGDEAPGPPVRLDFSTNVNAWGPAPSVVEAARRAPIDAYPDPACRAARRALARPWGMNPEQLRLAPGAAELIHRVCRVFLRAREVALIGAPTFGEYARAAALAGATIREVRAEEPELRLPLAELRAAARKLRPRLTFLCAPNNPTGEDPEEEGIREVLSALPDDGLLVLDDSFRSFAAGWFAPPLFREEVRRGRVLVLRSLTKDLALAGLRVGAVAGRPDLLDALDAGAVPWGVGGPAQAATEAAVQEPALARLRTGLAGIARERSRLRASLSRLGWEPLPSRTNYLLCRVPDAERVAGALAARGLRVRTCGSFDLPEYLRIAVRRPEENEVLLRALEAGA